MSSIRAPHLFRLVFVAASAAAVSACSSSSNNASPSSTGDASVTSDASVTMPGTAQTPPMGGINVEAWLAQGYYKQWSCESAVHASRSPSVHNFNRICSNDVIASHAGSTAEWPEGAAAVKELYQAVT